MDRVIDTTALATIVEREVKGYVRPSLNGLMVYVSNPKKQVYSVVWLSDDREVESGIVVLARLVDDKVVIHTDGVDEYPLSDDLMRAGIPREQILLAARGEPTLIPKKQTNADFAQVD
jgi:hypothetical protein